MAAAHVSSRTLFKHSPLTLRKHTVNTSCGRCPLNIIPWTWVIHSPDFHRSEMMKISHDEWLYFGISSADSLRHSSPAGPHIKRIHLTACSWVNKSRFMTGGWRVRSVTLSSSNPIHGSTLPARISINDTKEEIWKGIIPSYFPSFLADAALSWIIKHREGLHFTVFTPSSSYSQFYVRLSANNRLAAKQ